MKKQLFILWFFSCGVLYAQDQLLNVVKTKIDAKDFEGAKTDLKKIIEADPKNKGAYNLRGVARMGLNDFYGAIGDFNVALEIDSTFAESWNNRGEIGRAHV